MPVLMAASESAPFLVMESARLCEAPASGDFLAAAIEMIHCYSLIHDDLPAMDNSDLRRGRPSLHKHSGEATAILAGDSLLTASFEVVAKFSPFAPPVTVELIRALAQAAGGQGMCGGQSLDILGAATTPAEIGRMQRLKTGALIEFSARSGAIMVAETGARRLALQTYAEALGLAFQIADDISGRDRRQRGYRQDQRSRCTRRQGQFRLALWSC